MSLVAGGSESEERPLEVITGHEGIAVHIHDSYTVIDNDEPVAQRGRE